MRRVISLFVIFLLILTGSLLFTKSPVKIGLIPLDSRPCNTQYPELLATMSNAKIEIPYQYLDSYLLPADTEGLWNWLNNSSKNFGKIIINTNELFNGGLIASRHPSSYKDWETKIKNFEKFCLENKNKEVIVITVLPRLLPSQFTHLWKYKDELITYAKKIDKYSLAGKKNPLPPKNIPENILDEYLSIYKNTNDLVRYIISLTNQGLVDHYLIGQDDAEKYGLSNKIIRELTTEFNEKIQFVHGADELTMLALTKTLSSKSKPVLSIAYTNDSLKNNFFPFEAAELENVLKTKMEYFNISLNTTSPHLEIIHNDFKEVPLLEKKIREKERGYLGIMDIAYTNRGDISLLDFIFSQKLVKKIDGYAGWNTASNTIGTELAHFVSYQYLQENFKKYKKTSKEEALQALIKFKYIRVTEDLVYQGILREKLNKELTKRKIDPYHLGEFKSEANKILEDLYKPYQEKLANALSGDYQVGTIQFTVNNITSKIELPWERTFEAKVVPQVNITIK